MKPSILRGFAKVLQVPPSCGNLSGFLFPGGLLYICEFTFVNLQCSTWNTRPLLTRERQGAGAPAPLLSEISRESGSGRARPPALTAGCARPGSPRACALRLLALSLLARCLLAACSLLAWRCAGARGAPAPRPRGGEKGG